MGSLLWGGAALRKRRVVLCMTCLVALFGMRACPVRPGIVVGQSMAPAFHDGQVFLMSRLRPGIRLKRGDVVVFRVNGTTYIKRVRALPGDVVWGIDWPETEGSPDYLISSREELARWRRVARLSSAVGKVVKVTVLANRVFVVGDAINNSLDSRHFGPVLVSSLKGRVLVPSLFSLRHTNSGRYAAAAASGKQPPAGPPR
jgi:signal peptidase I